MSNILIIAAHPDDEVLGCGGTVARLTKEGHKAYTLVLGEGVTGRDEKRDKDNRIEEIEKLKKQMDAANEILGVKKVFTADFPDNRFDSVPILDIIKEIEKVKEQIKPDIVFTHYKNDLNIDHKITFEAVLTATRPMPDESVKEIFSFEVLSSTEWNYPLTFSPNIFYDIASTLVKKTNAIKKYQSEIRSFPHPRSVEGIKLNAQYWGIHIGQKYSEAFIQVRSIK